MKKKWKRLSVVCLAVLFSLIMPVGTIEAVENKPELQERDGLLDNPLFELVYAAENNSNLPMVEIKYQGQNLAKSMGGSIEYSLYINNRDQRISILAAQNSTLTSLYYYLDRTNGSTESKNEEALDSLWQSAEQLSYQEVALGQDGKYVLYVKAVDDNGQAACTRTSGIVVDSVSPVITGIQDGGTYPLGTKFGVEDDNLDVVLVNEQAAAPSDADGMYQVAANGTSCVIRAKDKAGHETSCSITVNGEGGSTGGDEPKDDTTVINKGGTYSLKAGAAYRLGSGSWTLEGDSSVYSGGITFYVNKDGDYSFKRQ